MSHTPSDVETLIAQMNEIKNREELLGYIAQYNALVASEDDREAFLAFLERYEDLLEAHESFVMDDNGQLIIFDIDAALAEKYTQMLPKPAIKASSEHSDISQPFTVYANFSGKTGAVTLTDKEFETLTSSSGLQLEVPDTSVSYQFKLDKDLNPTAYIEELPKDNHDLTLTVMNIIENIACHSRVVIIETKDEIAAGIANAYVEALRKSGLHISYDPIEPSKEFTGTFNIDSNKPWFKAAQALHRSVPANAR